MTEQQYRAALAFCSRLVELDPMPDTPDGCALLRVSAAIEAYELARFHFAQPTAEELAQFRREQEGQA